MDNAFVYLIRRFFRVLYEFLRRWYVVVFFELLRKTIEILESLDRSLALKITLRNFFRPLYQDYTIPGFIFGLFFRSTRVIIAAVLYIVIIVLAIFLYAFWAVLPFYILAVGFRAYFL